MSDRLDVPYLRLCVKSGTIYPVGSAIHVGGGYIHYLADADDDLESVTLGRDQSDDGRKTLRLRELQVSREHAALYLKLRTNRGGGNELAWYVKDLSSKHGTYLNGERVRKIRLKHGDTLEVGTTVFDVHIHARYACEACLEVDRPVANGSVASSATKSHSVARLGSEGVASAIQASKKTLRKNKKPEALQQLKDTLLEKYSVATDVVAQQPAEEEDRPQYLDRSRLRRERQPAVPALQEPAVAPQGPQQGVGEKLLVKLGGTRDFADHLGHVLEPEMRRRHAGLGAKGAY